MEIRGDPVCEKKKYFCVESSVDVSPTGVANRALVPTSSTFRHENEELYVERPMMVVVAPVDGFTSLMLQFPLSIAHIVPSAVL